MKSVSMCLLCAIGLLVIMSCGSKDPWEGFELPETNVLLDRAQWAVITSSHLRLRQGPTTSSGAVTTLWRGALLEIFSQDHNRQTVDNKEGYWYQIGHDGLSGWVFGAYLEFFDSREEAELFSRELRN